MLELRLVASSKTLGLTQFSFQKFCRLPYRWCLKCEGLVLIAVCRWFFAQCRNPTFDRRWLLGDPVVCFDHFPAFFLVRLILPGFGWIWVFLWRMSQTFWCPVILGWCPLDRLEWGSIGSGRSLVIFAGKSSVWSPWSGNSVGGFLCKWCN